MAKKYIVTLSTEECETLQKLLASGTARARKLTHARILLKAPAAGRIRRSAQRWR